MLGEKTNVGTHWVCVCYDKDGNLKWEDDFDNLVVNEGLDDLLQNQFNGSSYTATWYVGLKESGAVVAGDTMASHSNWSEITAYTTTGGSGAAALRPVAVLASASSQSVVTSTAAVFSINGTVCVAGGFIASKVTVGGNLGVLYGAGDFTAIRSVIDGDVVNVSLTLSASAS